MLSFASLPLRLGLCVSAAGFISGCHASRGTPAESRWAWLDGAHVEAGASEIAPLATESALTPTDVELDDANIEALLAGIEVRPDARWMIQESQEAEFAHQDQADQESKPSERRGLPPAFRCPPFPSAEYQGYPLVGVPPSDNSGWPLMKALSGTAIGEWLRENRIDIYGWVNASANLSTAERSNIPTSYWFRPDSVLLNQTVLRVERPMDSAQTDHVDVGFRVSLLYGSDYRYMTSGGWFSDQLLIHNNTYGFDPTELYVDVYIPRVVEGLILRAGRWVATPDIETQFAPDNYMGTHSLLFTHDTYTQTGVMATLMLDDSWAVQAGIHAGTDMAPWYEGAVATGMLGIRWVAEDNDDSVYLVLNSINDAEYQTFQERGQPAGHDNYNYMVGTWQHRFDENVHTKTEAYYMWQRDAFKGGTASIGDPHSYGGGGGLGAPIPGLTRTYGLLNFTMFLLSEQTFLTVRNEIWNDEDGARSGFDGLYTSHSIGITHNFTPIVQFRPEIGYYRNWENGAFDLGEEQGLWMIGFDVTLRF